MKKNESLLSSKFSKEKIDLTSVYGGYRNGTQSTNTECSGTGCSESTGKTETKPGVTDWEDIECGDETVKGSVVCPSA